MASASFCFAVPVPTGLLCNNKTNPRYIDSPAPSFSWSASTQVAYRLLVSTAGDFGELKWDSGIVTSSVKASLYAGVPLSGNTTYYWKVKVSSASGEYSQYSDTATFRMNLFLKKASFASGDLNTNEIVVSIGVGDLDNDGYPDIVLGGQGTEAMLRFYRNDGTGSFDLIFSTLSGKQLGGVLIRDVNNDGLNDVIAVAEIGGGAANQSSVVFLNEGNFVFRAVEELNPKKSFSAVCFDFNRDGNYDIIEGLTTGGGSGEQNTFYAGGGDGQFASASAFGDPNETNSIAAADFDGDGILDLLVLNHKNDTDPAFTPLAYAQVYKGDGAGGFTLAWTSPAPDYFNAAGIGDFNGDGLCDFIAATRSPSGESQLTEIGIYINGGNMSFTKASSVGGPRALATSLAVADLNNNGHLDFIAGWSRLGLGGRTRVYINDGSGNFSMLDETENLVYAQAVAIADFNKDGNLDYLAARRWDTGVELYSSTLADDLNPNSLPLAPSSGMDFKWQAGELHLQWGAGSDAETPANLLQYDLALRDAAGNVVISTVSGTVFSECSGFYGNMLYSTWTLLNVPRKTYFFSVITLDAQGGRSAPSAEVTVNERPYPGWDEDNVLLSTCTRNYSLAEILADPTKKGVIIVDFKLKDFENNQCTLKDFEYSLDSGSTWAALISSQVCVGFDQTFPSADTLNSAAKQTFYWKTNHASNPEVIRSTQCDTVSIRFKANDGYGDSGYCVSGLFEIDNERPTTPGDLFFSGIYTSTSVLLSFGSPSADVNFDKYIIYYNNDPSGIVNNAGDSIGYWTASNDINLGAEDFNGASSTTISGLSDNTTYYFRIYAYDTFGNNMGSDGKAVAVTNNRPTLSAVSVLQRNDGSGNVDFRYRGYDANNDTWSYADPLFRKNDGTLIPISSNTADSAFSDPLYFSSTGAVQNFVFNALDNLGQVYYYDSKVTFIVSDGIEDSARLFSAGFELDTLPPAGITAFKYRDHASSSIQLQWNLNADDSSIPVTEHNFLKYVIYYSTSPGVDENKSSWGPPQQTNLGSIGTRIASIDNLSTSTRYYLRLRAYDSYGNTFWAEGEVSVVTGLGPSSWMANVPSQSSAGDGLIGARILCEHPDDFDSFVNVQYSTSGSGAGASWYNASLSTEVEAFYYDGAYHYLTPPEINNSNYYQIGTSQNPLITSSGTGVALDIFWKSAEDLPGEAYANVFLRILVKDIYDVTQADAAISEPFTVDNIKPLPESAGYKHGAETYSAVNSAMLNIFCNKSPAVLSFEEIFISTSPLFPGAGASIIWLEEVEYNATLSSSTLYFNLSFDKWKQIAFWGRDADSLYLHLSSAALRDSAGNPSNETSIGINWTKDTNPPSPEGQYYDQNESDPAKMSGFRIQFNDEISGWAADLGPLLTVYTSTSGAETKVTFEDGITISTSSANIFWFYPSEEKHVEILNLGVSTLYLSCGGLGYDYSGNWIESISRANALSVPLTKETSAPWVIDYAPDGILKEDPGNMEIWVRFNESLYSQTVTADNVSLRKIRDASGDSVSEHVLSEITYVSSTCVISILPHSSLEYGCGYRVTVTDDIRDISLNQMLADFSFDFETIFDLSGGFTLSSGPVSITVPDGILSGSGRIEMQLDDDNEKISAAFLRESALATPSHRRMVGGVVTLELYDEFDNIISTSFAGSVTLSFAYEDSDADGFVDGLSPPVRVDSLAIYWLSETTSWIRLPTSRIDKAQKKVEADLWHFSSYALMGGPLFSISDAHPYPVPYKKSEDIGNGIIFSFPSGSDAKIEIYDIMGRLLETFEYTDATASVPGLFTAWTNVALPSGVYIYRIKAGENEKRGKLVIIQ